MILIFNPFAGIQLDELGIWRDDPQDDPQTIWRDDPQTSFPLYTADSGLGTTSRKSSSSMLYRADDGTAPIDLPHNLGQGSYIYLGHGSYDHPQNVLECSSKLNLYISMHFAHVLAIPTADDLYF